MTLYKPAIGNRIEDDIAGIASAIETLEFKGAMIRMDADQTIAHDTTTELVWGQAVYDVGGWWDVGTPARLTVPAGVSLVRVTTGVSFAAGATGRRWLSQRLDGLSFRGRGFVILHTSPTGATNLNVVSAVIQVVPGNYISAEVAHTQGANLDIVAAFNTFLAVEAVQ